MQLLIDQHVARTNRAMFLTGIALVAILSVAGWASASYYDNYFRGPRLTTLAEVVAARGVVPSRSWVRIQGELVETGYGEITTTQDKYTHREKSREVTANYLAILDEGHTLLVKAPPKVKGTEITGWLQRPEKVDKEVISSIRRDEPQVAGTLVPLVLDATETTTGGTFGLVALAGLLVAAAIVLRKWSARRARPEAHPIWKRLAKLGNARALAAEIDSQARSGDAFEYAGNVTLTRSWLLRKSTYGFDTVPLERLAWIHKKVTTQKQYFITVGKQYDAIVCDRDGLQLIVRANQEEVDRLLGALVERAPWVLAGWTAELEQAWKSQRANVIAAVDARREQLRRGPSAQQG